MTNLTHLSERHTFRRGSLMKGNPRTGRTFQTALFAGLTLLCFSTLAIAQAGHLDPNFGNGQPGIFGFSQSSANGSSSSVTGIALQSDGKIVIAGQAGNRSALLRLTTNGTLDSSFGSGGVVISRIGGDINQIFTSLALQSDGKILVTASGCPPRDELARFNADGSLDTSFGSSGIASLSFRVFAVTVQPDGKILATGENYPVALMARLLSTGQLDTSFGSSGQAPLIASASSIALQSDGKILVASGGISSGSLARYNTDGSLDKSFGISGQTATITPLNAIAVQSDGRIVGAGANTSRLSLNGNATGFGLVRFNTNGSIDATFGAHGGVTTAFANAVNTSAGSVRIQTNGDLVAAGSSGTSGTSTSFALARYLSTGKLDSTFGTAGLVTTSFGSNTIAGVASLVLQGDGKIVAAGTVSGSVIEVARYLGQ
jgi:uncharacterized delta-60 repeat protein